VFFKEFHQVVLLLIKNKLISVQTQQNSTLYIELYV